MPSHHLILCCPLLFLPSIFPSITVFSNESALCSRWLKYWSFSFNISPSNYHSGLISSRMDWLDLPGCIPTWWHFPECKRGQGGVIKWKPPSLTSEGTFHAFFHVLFVRRQWVLPHPRGGDDPRAMAPGRGGQWGCFQYEGFPLCFQAELETALLCDHHHSSHSVATY